MQGGNLVAQRLAGSGRHDRERVIACDDAVNDFTLSGAQIVEAKSASKNALDLPARSALHGFQADANAVPAQIAASLSISGTIPPWYRSIEVTDPFAVRCKNERSRLMTHSSAHCKRSAE